MALEKVCYVIKLYPIYIIHKSSSAHLSYWNNKTSFILKKKSTHYWESVYEIWNAESSPRLLKQQNIQKPFSFEVQNMHIIPKHGKKNK